MLYKQIVIYKSFKRAKVNTLIQLSKIFSDKNRLLIITLLLRDKALCVCEICDTLELSQPLVSRHLKQMKEAGVLEAAKEKKWVIYTLTTMPHPFLQTLLNELQKEVSNLPTIITCNKN